MAFVQLVLLNEMYAVGIPLLLLPEVGDVEITKVFPPAVYPVPTNSPLVVYAVVVVLMLAAAVYRATLNVLGVVGPKLCTACSS